ncbi:MAG: hypothetical protein LC099_03005 [Anaerolineales bacterium]|nr:hypothetical protein [Anaerolineales bacterium]
MRELFNKIGDFLQTPIGAIVGATVLFHGVLLAIGFKYSVVALVVAAIILGINIFAARFLADKLTYFFAQFVLPIHTPKNRQQIYQRVRDFAGDRGPILFVKNGRVIMHEDEAKKKGAGVIVLDSASAVVMQTETQILGAVGPGVHFTKGSERIARDEGVDLRVQWHFIGPLVGDQSILRSESADSSKYAEAQKRRQQTAGQTRDGFEISPTISIKFRVQRPQTKIESESGVVSHYGYNAQAVLNAVTREVMELDDDRSRLEWRYLPASLVANLWREYARKFRLEDLFPAEGVSGLKTIEEMINRRLKRADVVALDDTGLPTGEALPSLEYRQLTERGLEALEIRIHNAALEAPIEEQIVKNWQNEWGKIANREAELLDERENLIETAAHGEAVKYFARLASQKFDNPITPPADAYATLQALIEPVKEALLNESRANKLLESDMKKLDEVWKWLLVGQLDLAAQSETEEA